MSGDGARGELLLREGQPVAAIAGEPRDVQALRRLLLVERGNYAFQRRPVTEPARIPVAMGGLLREACPLAAPCRAREPCPRGCRLEAVTAPR